MDDAIPYGYCHCGCGRKTPISRRTGPAPGRIKGQPLLYLMGHHLRKQTPTYSVEDRGYKTPCWIWQGKRNRGGYGVVCVAGRYGWTLAHREMYERLNGAIPGHKQLDHLCRQRPCVNPDHVEAVDNATNSRRGARTKLTWDTVRAMRAATGTCHEIGRRFGISPTHVSKIRTGKRWRE